jgi:hypothetical protein
VYAYSNSSKAVYGKSNTGHSGYFEGGLGLYCDDMVETAEFKMATSASAGHVLTSDGSGVGTWQAPAATSDGDWTISGDDVYHDVGLVGIGHSSPAAKLDISSDGHLPLKVTTDGGYPSAAVFERAAPLWDGHEVLELVVEAGGTDNYQFIEAKRGFDITFEVEVDGAITSDGKLTVIGDDQVQAEFESGHSSDGAVVVSAVSTATGAYDVIGVYGESAPSDQRGIGGKFKGGWHGVQGIVEGDGLGAYVGVYGWATLGNGTCYGVRGEADGPWSNYGVYGTASGGSSSNYAGYFAGDAHVTGTFTAGTKSFKIDHPLDPESKYLVHSCVESDEMMNIYNGNVVLDARGEAWVEMPGWFEALNQDFRYQLTAIGAPGPNLYIGEEISGGRFLIAGGEPGSKVSWQVTGVRHDPLAEASRTTVEVDKRPDEIGKYMHPEAYGKPVTMGVDYREEREIVTDSSSDGRAPRARQKAD